MGTRTRVILKAVGLVLGVFLVAIPIAADTPDRDESWSEVASDGKSVVFGRFVGKFESIEFRSRRIRLREVSTGKNETLEIDDALGYIAETIKPGLYDVLGFEAVYYPQVRSARPGRYRPLRQRFGLSPKSGDAQAAFIHIPKDRPVYIGTIKASNELDGVVYRGHQLRVLDEYDEAFDRLESFYPVLTASLDRDGIVPARHFMLKPTRPREPLERVVGLDDPIRQARDYIADGKYRQAVSWLETFMPVSDGERAEAKLLVGEAMLGDGKYAEAIEELGEVLLIDPEETRALRLLARAHALDGHLEDARDLYTALTEAIPDDAEAHLHLGYLHALKDNAVAAQEEFHAAFQTDFDYLLNDLVPFFRRNAGNHGRRHRPLRTAPRSPLSDPAAESDGFEAPVRIRRICRPHRPSRKGDRRPNRSAIFGNDAAYDALAHPGHLRARELERDPNPRRRVVGLANTLTVVDQHSVVSIQHSEAHAMRNRSARIQRGRIGLRT